LADFGGFCNDLADFGGFCNDYFRILQRFATIIFGFCNDLQRFATIWRILQRFGGFWRILQRFGGFWRILQRFGGFCNDLADSVECNKLAQNVHFCCSKFPRKSGLRNDFLSQTDARLPGVRFPGANSRTGACGNRWQSVEILPICAISGSWLPIVAFGVDLRHFTNPAKLWH
jgi:hypothetical protein